MRMRGRGPPGGVGLCLLFLEVHPGDSFGLPSIASARGHATSNARRASSSLEAVLITFERTRRADTRRTALLSFCLLVVSRLAEAQPAEGPEFRVNPSTTNDQVAPDVSVNSASGQFVVVWAENTNCFGQRFDAAAVPLGEEFPVAGACVGGAAVTSLAPGGFVTVGISYNGVTFPLSGQLFPESGPGVFFVPNTYASGKKADVRLASDAAGNFVAVWSSTLEDGDGYGVFARRYLYSGEPAGFLPEFRVNSTTTGNQFAASVARDAAGDFVIVWESAPHSGCCAQVMGQRYDLFGTPQGGEFLADNRADVGSYLPDVASDTSGNFVVVWTGYNEYGNLSYNVHGQRYSSSGAPLGGVFRVNTYTVSVAGRPRVTHPDADFVVVWQELQADGSGYAVLGRRYGSDGSSIGGAFRVNTYTTGAQQSAAIGSRPHGPYIVVWESNQVPGSLHDIFGQRYCLNGDVNGDGTVDVADVFYLINFLYASGPAPLGCSDVDGSSTIDISDVFYLINYLFAGGPAPK
jgi:hypothetical protein